MGKSSNPNGFSTAFYKQFRDTLAPILNTTFNSFSDICTFPHQSQEAHITLIPKAQKDPTPCSSYRPISLINFNLKTHAKLLLNRLRPFFPSIIGLDQVGFVFHVGLQTTSLRQSPSYLTFKNRKFWLCFLSLDAEKAFDRLDGPSYGRLWNNLTRVSPLLYIIAMTASYYT